MFRQRAYDLLPLCKYAVHLPKTKSHKKTISIFTKKNIIVQS